MKYTQKAKEIEAFTFPIEVEVSRPTIQDSRVLIAATPKKGVKRLVLEQQAREANGVEQETPHA